MEDKKYLITQEQLETIQHFKRMFENQAEIIEELCSNEKSDIVYGFALGKLYNYQRDCFAQMIELELSIIEQKILK